VETLNLLLFFLLVDRTYRVDAAKFPLEIPAVDVLDILRLPEDGFVLDEGFFSAVLTAQAQVFFHDGNSKREVIWRV